MAGPADHVDYGESVSGIIGKHMPVPEKRGTCNRKRHLGHRNVADQNGKQQSRVVLEANAVGHDLNYGVSTLRKVLKPNNEPKPAPAQTSHAGPDPYAQQSAGPVEVLGGNESPMMRREASTESGEPEGWNIPAETDRIDGKAAEFRKDGEFDGQEF